MEFLLEVIGFNIESCTLAQEAGANRIELCDGPGEGGTTPSYGFIKAARKKLNIDLYPIIRPRGGDFLYTDDEFEIMKTDILVCKKLGCDGVVTGSLNADGTVDKRRCSQLVEIAFPMGVTFHRAFDRTKDPFTALEDIIECGFERILTSGLEPDAMQGASLIASLIEKADERIVIMPGSGIRSDNIGEIANRTKAHEFHTSARINSKSRMDFLQQRLKETLQSVSVDTEEVKKIRTILSAL
ncbi:MAG: copper homeostasis protein CutC [Bacteroidetes bacterium]|nr:copper homeostasis protein CutC [Bacteroidota bacterium]